MIIIGCDFHTRSQLILRSAKKASRAFWSGASASTNMRPSIWLQTDRRTITPSASRRFFIKTRSACLVRQAVVWAEKYSGIQTPFSGVDQSMSGWL